MKSPYRLLGLVLLIPLAAGCVGESGAGAAREVSVSESRPSAPALIVPAGFNPPGLSPEVFAPGLVSTEGNQANAVVYPGGREIYFWSVERRADTVAVTIRVTREDEGIWSAPEVVPFSGVHKDMYLALHPDGSRMYFQSDRPIDPAESTFEYNLWYVEREGDGWSEARSLGRPVNGRNHTGGASVTRDGTLYFTLMDLEGGRQDLYRSQWKDGAFEEPERLPDEVNVGYQNCDSYVAPDESYLVFLSFPGVGHTNNPGRLLISRRDSEGRWAPARELGPAFDQGDAPGSVTLSTDGRFVFFSRETPGGGTGRDVYWVSTRALDGLAASGGK